MRLRVRQQSYIHLAEAIAPTANSSRMAVVRPTIVICEDRIRITAMSWGLGWLSLIAAAILSHSIDQHPCGHPQGECTDR